MKVNTFGKPDLPTLLAMKLDGNLSAINLPDA